MQSWALYVGCDKVTVRVAAGLQSHLVAWLGERSTSRSTLVIGRIQAFVVEGPEAPDCQLEATHSSLPCGPSQDGSSLYQSSRENL